MGTYLTDIEMATINCKCGGTYAITERFRLDKHKVGGSWTCPYCQTGWGYASNSLNDKLRRDLDRKTSEVERQKSINAHTQVTLQTTRHQLRAEKGAKTKLKKRITDGMCPCCDRHFQNVRHHIKHMHPDYPEAT